jgi:hypothetical protein
VRLPAFLVLASMSVTLTGCFASSQENTAQIDAADNEKCVSYGTTPGTPAYTDCRMKLEKMRKIAAVADVPPPRSSSGNCPTSASGVSCIGF